MRGQSGRNGNVRILLDNFLFTEQLPGPVIEGHDSEGSLKGVGEGPRGAEPLERATHAHEKLQDTRMTLTISTEGEKKRK